MSRQTILIVEDESAILEIVTFLLEEEGFEVLQARDGVKALCLLQEISPDLIVSDVKMPGMDGFALCQRIRSNPSLAQVPFIFLTGRGEKADVRRGMGLGADDYLIKPFDPEELLSAVRVRLARAAETRAAISREGVDLQESIVRTLTHEFRTPLALVVGYTELLESTSQEVDEEELSRILQGLHAGSNRLKRLVEDFLLLSQLRSGVIAREIGLEKHHPIVAKQVVDMVVAQVRGRAAGGDVTILVNHETSNLTVAVGIEHLKEIVERLVDNAIKFSKSDGGRVVVDTRQDGRYWVLGVADDGIGICEEALSWVFEAFRQVDRAKMEQQGAGVGLTIVRGLVEVYGGQVSVESELGQGSSFTVRLPLTAA